MNNEFIQMLSQSVIHTHTHKKNTNKQTNKKSVPENKSRCLCFLLILWSLDKVKATESEILWLWSMLLISIAGLKRHGWEWTILVLLKNKKISSRGPLSWRNSMFVSCVFKRRWRLGGRKCRKMPESDICVCRKAKVVELHIVCMFKKKKKEKNFLILKVWFYENSVKLRQSPTHEKIWLNSASIMCTVANYFDTRKLTAQLGRQAWLICRFLCYLYIYEKNKTKFAVRHTFLTNSLKCEQDPNSLTHIC